MLILARNKQLKRTFFFIGSLLAIISVAWGINLAGFSKEWSQDCQWGPARVLLKGGDPYAYFLNNINNGQVQNDDILHHVPSYPATGLVFEWFLAIFPWSAAKWIWILINLLLPVWLVYFVSFEYLKPGKQAFMLMILLLYTGTPVRIGIATGQQAVYCLALFCLALWVRKRSTVISGILLAASWLKYTLTFPLSLFFLRTRKMSFIAGIAITVHLVILVLLRFYTATSFQDLLSGPLHVFQARFTPQNSLVGIPVILSNLGINSLFIQMCLSAGLPLLAFFAVRRIKDELTVLTLLALVSMTFIFHAAYDFVVLIFPLALIIREKKPDYLHLLMGIIIVLIWYVDGFLWLTSHSFTCKGTALLLNVMFWFRATLFYTVIILMLKRAFSGAYENLQQYAA